MFQKFIKYNLLNNKLLLNKNYFSDYKNVNSYYEILNVSPNAKPQEIRDAYLKLAKMYHPDLHSDNEEIHKKFLLINEAYSILSHPVEREDYDLRNRLQSMEVQQPNILSNPWSVIYPAPPTTKENLNENDYQVLIKTYKLQTNKMWRERISNWYSERQHFQASRGLSLDHYNLRAYLNFRIFNRFSGQEVFVLSIIFGIGIAFTMGKMIFYRIKTYIYDRNVNNDKWLEDFDNGIKWYKDFDIIDARKLK